MDVLLIGATQSGGPLWFVLLCVGAMVTAVLLRAFRRKNDSN